MPSLTLDDLQWVIVGGESGPGARPLAVDWVLDLHDRTTAAGAKFFLKQLGSVWARENGYRGKAHHMDEWPEELRTRDMPVADVAAVGNLVAV